MGLKIYVCVKHVPDTAATIRLTGDTEFDESVVFVLNPYDENAVEAALQVRQAHEGSEVVAVCLGKQAAENSLRSAMAMGADRGILVKTEKEADPFVTALALKAAIEKDGRPDLVFTGKLSVDAEGMQTMFRLAALFDMPVVSEAVHFSLDGSTAEIHRDMGAGARDVFEADLPCVIGAAKGLNTPRYPKFPDIVKARKKPVAFVELDDLDLPAPGGKVTLLAMRPAREDRKRKMLEGGPRAMVEQLVDIFEKEARLF